MAESSGKHRVARAALGIAAALAFFFACNAAITFVLEPYGSKSELTWHDYYEQTDIDTIIAGSSLAKAALDPDVLDNECGISAYNLSSPSQALEESLVAVRTAYEDHGINRAILGLSCTTLTEGEAPGPESAFIRERNKPRSLLDAFAVDNEMLWHYGSASSTDSINFMFPWVKNHCDLYVAAVKDNVWRKMHKIDMARAAEQLEPGWTYLGFGAGAQLEASSGDVDYEAYAMEGSAKDGGEPTAKEDASVNADRTRTLREICDYCASHDIELIFISAPLPLTDYLGEGSAYAVTMGEAADIVTSAGASFYDFNYTSPALFEREERYFADSTHFNVRGCEAFSHAFGRFLNDLDAGRDVSAYFV